MPHKNKEEYNSYMREYNRIWISKRRDEYFSDKSCYKCGETNNLELHHLDPTKKSGNTVWGWAEKRRENELKICVPVCKQCHREETRLSFIKTITHCPKNHPYDEENTYYNKNQRVCRLCRREATKKWRQKKNG